MKCITLLSDFGLQDAAVAATKGLLMQQAPGIPVVDISHMAVPFHLQQAAYLLTSAYKNFPEGSCHMILCDVFYQKKPRLILCQADGHYFLAPDNGLLSIALAGLSLQSWQCYVLPANGIFKDWLLEAIGVAVSLQSKTPAQLATITAIDGIVQAPGNFRPRIDTAAIECQIIHIDRYENVVINLTRQQFEEARNGRNFRIQFMRDEEVNIISTHYSSVREGEKLCRFNASGYLEIAVNKGNAASLFGLRLPNEQHLLYNTIKIFFE